MGARLWLTKAEVGVPEPTLGPKPRTTWVCFSCKLSFTPVHSRSPWSACHASTAHCCWGDVCRWMLTRHLGEKKNSCTLAKRLWLLWQVSEWLKTDFGYQGHLACELSFRAEGLKRSQVSIWGRKNKRVGSEFCRRVNITQQREKAKGIKGQGKGGETAPSS